VSNEHPNSMQGISRFSLFQFRFVSFLFVTAWVFKLWKP
jgi:hypothetical protein